MEIRCLTADDAEVWSNLRLQALERDPAAFSSSVEEHRDLTPIEIARRLTLKTDSFVVGAFDEGTLIGIAGFRRESGPKSRHKGWIWGVYVAAGKRGQGVGRRMMEALA